MFTDYFSASARVPVPAGGEHVLTADDLARQFRVSKKTVSRWRRLGLVGRPLLFEGRTRIGFLQSCVDRFVAENAEHIGRAASFCRLTSDERRQIIERARALAQAGMGRTEIAGRIALETGRSHEAVRSTLDHFDREHPEQAIFPYNHGPLPIETKQQIAEEYRRGETAEALARRFGRTSRGICRIIQEMRAARIVELPLDCIDNEQFPNQSSEQRAREILGPPPENSLVAKSPQVPTGLPAYMARLYDVPLLTREQEAHLFRKMNFLKHLAGKLREALVVDHPKQRLMDQIEELYEESVATKNQIISANLRLVVSIAKRYVGPAAGFFELVSDGNLSLMRAVEKFDISRGNGFSTYATWAIMKNYARSIPAGIRYLDRFRTSQSELLSATVELRTDQHELESDQLRRESQVKQILGCLDERELQIIAGRFGLARGQAPLTLKQVGAVMGVTKERIRQIQTRAMAKLRMATEEEGIDFDRAIIGPAGNPPAWRDPAQYGTSTGGD